MALANSFFGFRAGHLLVIEFVVLRSNLTWCTLSCLDFIDCIFYGLGSFGFQHVFVLVEPVVQYVLGFTIIGNWKHSMIIFGLYCIFSDKAISFSRLFPIN